jgi:hypothetical protein
MGIRKFGNGDAFDGEWIDGKQARRNNRKFQSAPLPEEVAKEKDVAASWLKKIEK